MAEYFAGGHLRFLDGEWRDDNGDVVDIVEVVRCRDCKKFILKGEEFLVNDTYGFCEKSRTGVFDDGEEVYGNDFCSCGQRK